MDKRFEIAFSKANQWIAEAEDFFYSMTDGGMFFAAFFGCAVILWLVLRK
jgi:hypothetical protein